MVPAMKAIHTAAIVFGFVAPCGNISPHIFGWTELQKKLQRIQFIDNRIVLLGTAYVLSEGPWKDLVVRLRSSCSEIRDPELSKANYYNSSAIVVIVYFHGQSQTIVFVHVNWAGISYILFMFFLATLVYMFLVL